MLSGNSELGLPLYLIKGQTFVERQTSKNFTLKACHEQMLGLISPIELLWKWRKFTILKY